MWDMSVVGWYDKDYGKTCCEFVSKRNVDKFCKLYNLEEVDVVNLGEVRTVGDDVQYYSVIFRDCQFEIIRRIKPYKFSIDNSGEMARNPTRNHYCLKKISENLHEIYMWATSENEAIKEAGLEYLLATKIGLWNKMHVGQYELIRTKF